jgi:hypothetical protein
VGERHADGAADQRQEQALEQQAADDPTASRPERRAHGELLLAPLGPHEQQRRHVRAGDEQHDADRAHDDPEHVADVAHHLGVQGSQRRRDPEQLVDARVDALGSRPAAHPDRHHPADVGVGFLHGDARLQTRDPLEAEAGQDQRAAIEPQREDQIGVRVEDPEARRHHADDFPGLALDDDGAADDGWIAAEAALPVAVREHHPGRPTGPLIGLRQPPADDRRDAERLERAVRQIDATHFFRFTCAGHVRR